MQPTPLIVLSFSLLLSVACAVTAPSDDEGFCNIESDIQAECTPIDKGVLQEDKKKKKSLLEMIGYTCFSPGMNAKIQIYIEELKVRCE